MKGAEGAAVDGVAEFGQRSDAAPGDEIEHAGIGVRAVEPAVGAAIELRFFIAGRAQIGEVHSAANVVGRNAVDDHHVRVRGATAHVERSDGSDLTGAGDLGSGLDAQLFFDGAAGVQGLLADYANGSAGLCFGSGNPGGGDHDLLRHHGG